MEARVEGRTLDGPREPALERDLGLRPVLVTEAREVAAGELDGPLRGERQAALDGMAARADRVLDRDRLPRQVESTDVPRGTAGPAPDLVNRERLPPFETDPLRAPADPVRRPDLRLLSSVEGERRMAGRGPRPVTK